MFKRVLIALGFLALLILGWGDVYLHPNGVAPL